MLLPPPSYHLPTTLPPTYHHLINILPTSYQHFYHHTNQHLSCLERFQTINKDYTQGSIIHQRTVKHAFIYPYLAQTETMAANNSSSSGNFARERIEDYGLVRTHFPGDTMDMSAFEAYMDKGTGD